MLVYAPDATDVAPEVLSAISGVPTLRGYRAPPSAFDFSLSAMTGTPVGGVAVDGIAFVANGTKVYTFSSLGFNDVSRTGDHGNGRIRVCKFGSLYLLSNGVNKLAKSSGSTFTDITAPSAFAMDAAGYFVMLGDCDDTGLGIGTTFGDQPDRWWCSHYADAETTWLPSVTTQCASGRLSDTPGGIKGVVAMGSDFIFYKQDAMYRAYYVGPPEVFKFELISNRVGCGDQAGVVKVKNEHYFIGSDNFYRFDGTRPVPIGSGIAQSFFAGMTVFTLAETQARYDHVNEVIYWHYRPIGVTGAMTKVMAYHIPSGRWGAFDLTAYLVLIGELPSLFETTVADTRRRQMMYIDGSKFAKSLSEAGTALTFTTNWYGDQTAYSLVRRVRTKFRTGPTSGTVTHSTAPFIGGTVSSLAAATWGLGRADFLASGRYHRDAHSYVGDSEIEVCVPEMVTEGDE